jgi:hypothetical protein
MVYDLEEDFNSRGPLEHVDFSACFIEQFALRDQVPRTCRIDRPGYEN